jgi:hypothetical protein
MHVGGGFDLLFQVMQVVQELLQEKAVMPGHMTFQGQAQHTLE